ncbi:MAG: PAS domain S-box protein [Candidatus Abyssobacteria bacterium SURF_17]|uniref:histidine kinase n=1 Tax=Candidatus Abyssobacteria bacterium SURF_17 TaxID=2093361 RepID=A0A419EVN0_9BACT|nr:MAG: PAS domain S-box protein [Candidatus Abyssubacteria bacterium SURF_17]
MAPRKGDSNELARFLSARKESVVTSWVGGLLANPNLRRKLTTQLSREGLSDTAARIYDALIMPLSTPTERGKTRKVRLKESEKRSLATLSLHERLQAQFILLDVVSRMVRRHYSKNPKKAEKHLTTLSARMHDLLLSTAKKDVDLHAKTATHAERKYERLLDMANDAIFLLEFESGLFTEVNKAACELTGYSESELKRMGFNSLVSVFDLNLALEKTNSTIERGAIRFDDLSIFTKKGAALPVDISASAVTINKSKHVLAIVRDIKERKELERRLRQEADKLRLINEIAAAISSVELDIEAVLTTILTSVARVIRVEAGSVLKLEDGELVFMVALGEKAEYVKPFRLKLGQGIAGWVARTGEGVVVTDAHRDPRYYAEVERATGFVSKSMLAAPMKTGDKTVGVIELINKVGGQFTKKDLELITAISSFAAVALEHARLYSECELARARLSEACSPVSSSRLAAVVAHEMKDPLGIVKNYVHILVNKLASAGTQHEELRVVSEEIDRIASITDQLLHFSEAYSEEPKATPLNLLVENAVDSMQEGLSEAGIVTEMKLDRSLPQVSAIPNQIKMVFANLIRLAISEMPNGGTLTISTRKRDSSAYIEFSSTGKKHTSEEADELFLPSAVAKGLVPKGLGLYMIYNIIQGYGGDIEVKSRSRGGNTFRIRIPLNAGVSRGASK